MTRKLRNSLNALTMTAALFATGAFAVASLPFVAPPGPAATQAAAAAHDEPGRRKVGHLRRIRHSLAMPYFSFVPRG